MAKVILLSYLERNKKISIPGPEQCNVGDMEYLRREFLKSFCFEKNVKLTITFQTFDPEWDDYVDLEEDAVVRHKDKLKVVVSPRLSDSVPSSTTASLLSADSEGLSGPEFELLHSEVNPITSTPMSHSLPKNGEADSDDDLLHLSVRNRKRRRLLDDDLLCTEELQSNPNSSVTNTSTPNTSAYSADIESDHDFKKDSKDFLLVGIPHVVKKTKEDSTPLPDPFPLPTNFRPDVHVCLTKRKMTKSTRAAYFTSVAAAMFQFKRYPSRDDYVSVARQIVAKYPFLGSKGLGASHEGIVQTLIDRFKDMRRSRKPRKVDPEKPKKERILWKKAPGTHNPLVLPEVPEGEDSVSFERHNRVLRIEWKKPSRNAMVVEELMERTFAMRRHEIMENSCDVQTLFTKFPFLQDSEQLLKELELITSISIDESRRAWAEKWTPKVFEQANLEASTCSAVSSACAEVISLGENDPLVAMAVLIYLLPDSRCKPDHAKVLYFIQGSQLQLQEVVKRNKQQSPYILVTTFPERQAFLIVDKSVVCECKLQDVPLLLMSAFYTFNICYTHGCHSYFAFLECVLLGSKARLPASVKHLLAALDSE